MISEAGEYLTHKYEIVLLDLDFKILKFLLANGPKINFEIPQIFYRLSKSFSKKLGYFNCKFCRENGKKPFV